MPIYEYNCAACENRFELLVPISEASVTPACPSCKSPETRKLLSLFASPSPGKSTGGGPSGSEGPKSSGGGGHCGPGSCGCGRF
ncbi:MAG: zinc ribbon domain-containing protein [Candidatus Wallbacteria bacterium]|nr:zinc ribbon domain-containing protein [Candidatus Wallbacteria bacterium]